VLYEFVGELVEVVTLDHDIVNMVCCVVRRSTHRALTTRNLMCLPGTRHVVK